MGLPLTAAMRALKPGPTKGGRRKGAFYRTYQLQHLGEESLFKQQMHLGARSGLLWLPRGPLGTSWGPPRGSRASGGLLGASWGPMAVPEDPCGCGAGYACKGAGAFLLEWGLGAPGEAELRARGSLKKSFEGL